MKKIAITALTLVASGGVVYYVSDAAPPTPPPPSGGGGNPPHLQWTGAPLFPFGDLYRDGRSAWLARRFEADVDAFRTAALDPLPAPIIDVRIHDGPFTDGDWVAHLDEWGARQRTDAESHAVEVHVRFEVPGAPVDRLLAWLACAAKRSATTVSYAFTEGDLPAALPSRPALGRREFLGREDWAGEFGAQPTSAYQLYRVEDDGDVRSVVSELWANTGTDGTVPLLFSASRYSVASRDGCAVVDLRVFYRGQSFPSLVNSWVRSRTSAFYEDYVKKAREGWKTWQPESVLSPGLGPFAVGDR